MGRPFPTPWVKGRAGISSPGDLELIQEDYVVSIIEKLNSICANVSLSPPSENPTHSFAPGQSVLIKSLKPTRVGEPNYYGPAKVIAITRTGVLTDHQPQWIHASRLKHHSAMDQDTGDKPKQRLLFTEINGEQRVRDLAGSSTARRIRTVYSDRSFHHLQRAHCESRAKRMEDNETITQPTLQKRFVDHMLWYMFILNDDDLKV
ncbi:uncharacterized protein [Paramisgurnus dabryanus]|uniref:uncharacterized protein isoform X2 n=1 Tax=Paramisgurnus dabryanus TaxID=90735 RepID=UPI0031F408A7